MPLLNPHVTKQSFGKATARSRKTLPMSSHNKIAVVVGLANCVGLNLEGKMTQNVRQIQKLSNDTKETVRDF